MFKEIFIATLATTLGVLGYSFYYFFKQKLNMWRFNGPLALPVVGNLYDPAAISFLKYMTTLRQRYGPLYTLFTFFTGFLVVCDPEVVRRILSDNKLFYKGNDYTDSFSLAFGEGLVTSNGEKHKRDRAIFGRYFTRSSMAQCAAKFNVITKKCVSELIDSKFSNSNKELHINIEQFFAILSLRNFMNYALSTDLSADLKEEEELCEVVSKGSNAMGVIIAFGLPNWSWLPPIQAIRRFTTMSASFFHRIVAQRLERMEKGLDEDVDDCLTAMIKDQMPEDEMMEHFATLVAAGHDTTSYFLSYMTYLLAAHQDVQDKLYDHIKEKLGHKGEDETISSDDFGKLTYLHLVMKETLRYYAIIPAVTRVAAEEVYIKEANVTLPKGANLLCPMIVLNRDPNIWENPNEFNPERFADKGSDFTSAKQGYFPFGYGSRVCIGNYFAQLEAGIVLVMMLRKYRFDPEPGFKPLITSGISLTTMNGINVVIRRRGD
eukprot:scaffold1900_cov183-Ochromonas_danica.AAC.18